MTAEFGEHRGTPAQSREMALVYPEGGLEIAQRGMGSARALRQPATAGEQIRTVAAVQLDTQGFVTGRLALAARRLDLAHADLRQLFRLLGRGVKYPSAE